MYVIPYLNFNGRADEAIEFYKSAVGAKVNMLMRFKDMPGERMPHMKPELDNKVMHATVQVGDGVIQLSDGRCTGGGVKFEGISLSLSVKSEAEAERCFKGLSEKGEVTMPMEKTFFSARFGMLKDQFGVHWMVVVQ
jgi:PhnB protein